jgi:cytochrome c oxidase assembly factor CtaG
MDWMALFLAFLVCFVYVRGWLGLHARQPEKFTPARLAYFVSGIAVVLFAIVSPLDTFAGTLLQVHMAQHVLLMMIAPPLLWLGWPALPLLCGLPRTMQKYWVGPFLISKGMHTFSRFFVHPIVALFLFIVTTWVWHYPSAYQLALESDAWHSIEHGCFLFSAMLFWFPVIAPHPSKPAWPTWTMIPYLLAADIQNTIFSAFFSFASEPIYSFYPDLGLFGTTLLRDQSSAGGLMWVVSSAIFLIPVAFIVHSMLVNKDTLQKPVTKALFKRRVGQPKYSFLWLYSLPFRRFAQLCMFALALIVILDGLLGPSLSPLNLAGILPWIWWRGLVIIAILVAGNFFCFACPFMFVRELGKKLHFATARWPASLRNKWIAVALFVIWLTMYEVGAPWSSPVFTSWIIIGYFFCAFVIDAFFSGAAFCKWVCPIGQFHFVLSMLSPFEIKALSKSTCDSCTTQDCLRGNEAHRTQLVSTQLVSDTNKDPKSVIRGLTPMGSDPKSVPRRGCELELFVPTKQGNLDCTFCLDCVRACPHDNVVLAPSFPGLDLVKETYRGSVGSLQRPDYTALMMVVVFGAFANAAGMIAPVNRTIDIASQWIGAPSPKLVTAIFIICAAFIVPSFLCILAKKCSRTTYQVAWSLVPLGIAMWAAHLLFHFFTSYKTIIPVAQRVLHDLGLAKPPQSIWEVASTPQWLLHGELFLMTIGLLASFAICLRITTTLRARAPWCVLSVGLFLWGVWILLQPMQMRGMIA